MLKLFLLKFLKCVLLLLFIHQIGAIDKPCGQLLAPNIASGVPSFCGDFVRINDEWEDNWHMDERGQVAVCLKMKTKPFTTGGSNLLTKIGKALGAQIVFSLFSLGNDCLGFWFIIRASVPNSFNPILRCSAAASIICGALSAMVSCLLSYWTTVLHGLCTNLRFEPSNATLFCLLLNIIFVFSAVVEHKLLNIGMRRRGNLQGSSMFTAKNMNEWIWQKYNRLLYLLGLYPDDTNQNA
ncbi:hypothetical protein niasHT_017596 [Heterodera trifolii]|uniref:Transmembrane protein n=1 Tax=Heterodera trifolii TaxID=157864 RepID=A0ABD2KZL3_9BILA